MCLYTEEQLKDAAKLSYSFSDLRRRLGLANSGSGTKYIKAKLHRLEIDITHFDPSRVKREQMRSLGKLQCRSIEEILCSDSKVSQHVLRKTVKREELFPYVCAVCGNPGEHFGKVLCLQLDHINGVRNDNRIENLRWLCPNCHAQTDTWGNRKPKKPNRPPGNPIGKARSKIQWPPLRDLLEMIRQTSYVGVAACLGVSDTAIRRHLSRRQIDPKTLKFRGTILGA